MQYGYEDFMSQPTPSFGKADESMRFDNSVMAFPNCMPPPQYNANQLDAFPNVWNNKNEDWPMFEASETSTVSNEYQDPSFHGYLQPYQGPSSRPVLPLPPPQLPPPPPSSFPPVLDFSDFFLPPTPTIPSPPRLENSINFSPPANHTNDVPSTMPSPPTISVLPVMEQSPTKPDPWKCICEHMNTYELGKCSCCGAYQSVVNKAKEKILLAKIEKLESSSGGNSSTDQSSGSDSPSPSPDIVKKERKRRPKFVADSPQPKKKRRKSKGKNSRSPRPRFSAKHRHRPRTYASHTSNGPVLCPLNPRAHLVKSSNDAETDKEYKARKLEMAKDIASMTCEELSFEKCNKKVLERAIVDEASLRTALENEEINKELFFQLQHVVNAVRKTSKEDEFSQQSLSNPHIAWRHAFGPDMTLSDWVSSLPTYYRDFVPASIKFSHERCAYPRSTNIRLGEVLKNPLRTKRRVIVVSGSTAECVFAITTYSSATLKRRIQPSSFECSPEHPKLGAAGQSVQLFRWSEYLSLQDERAEVCVELSAQQAGEIYVGFWMLHDPWIPVIYISEERAQNATITIGARAACSLELKYMVKDKRAQPVPSTVSLQLDAQ